MTLSEKTESTFKNIKKPLKFSGILSGLAKGSIKLLKSLLAKWFPECPRISYPIAIGILKKVLKRAILIMYAVAYIR